MKYRKLIHKKGKSPRGKSLRGKSPRGKSPRSSVKKKVVRRLMLDESSPCKSKLETSKRALFQSPPSDHAGPSKLLSTNNTDSQKIKRVLFLTPKKNESEDAKQTSSREESRKRKYEEELQGPQLKWAKSLSSDCVHELKNTTKVTWDRHSSSSVLSKSETSVSQGKNELSDINKKVCIVEFSVLFGCFDTLYTLIGIIFLSLLISRNCFGRLRRLYEAKALARVTRNLNNMPPTWHAQSRNLCLILKIEIFRENLEVQAIVC